MPIWKYVSGNLRGPDSAQVEKKGSQEKNPTEDSSELLLALQDEVASAGGGAGTGIQV